MPRLESQGFDARASAIHLPDRERLGGLLAELRPAAVVHLAAVSFLPAAERDPQGAAWVNVKGTESVLDALDDVDRQGGIRMVFASTGHVYRPGGERPLDEDSPLEPQSVYGRTKLEAERICREACQAGSGRPLWIFRAFNHTGPGQRPDFAAPSFARQTARIEAGLEEPVLRTGDLAVRRDFCDVRDVVRAYSGAAGGDFPPGTYNLASGRAASLAEMAGFYRSLSGVPFEIRPRSEPGRAGEAREFRGSAERIRNAAGWRPEIPLETTLRDLLAEWRARVVAGEDIPPREAGA
jgi:GDP-4-dehydro-6-deoxy-D-mannose reductase